MSFNFLYHIKRCFGSSSILHAQKSFQLVVVGGGSGGCTIASKFTSLLGTGRVAVIEPQDTHYYQPMWTLVGGGLKKLSESERPMASVLPTGATWIKDHVVSFKPEDNKVFTSKREEISYDFLVIAMGLQLHYDKIKGLRDALKTPGVGSNFHKDFVLKTAQAISNFKGGKAIFTFPNTPIKCAGAPQKIMYIAEDTFRKAGKRDRTSIEYHTSLPFIFGVEKYAKALNEICHQRNISVNLRSNLIEVKPDVREVIFENLDTKIQTTHSYDLLHVTPPMSAPDSLRNCEALCDASGYLNVDKYTLQHLKFSNIFGIGDCTNIPTSKTAAAVAAQCGVLRKNLQFALGGGNNVGKSFPSKYDGYTSCPLVVGTNRVILAEFDFSVPPQPLETFPFDQGKPRRLMFFLKFNLMPVIYWWMLRGFWEGPAIFRKILHLGTSR